MATRNFIAKVPPSVPRQLIRGALQRAAVRLLEEIKREAPISSGRLYGPKQRREAKPHLRDTFSVKVVGDTIQIVSTSPYADAVNDGVDPLGPILVRNVQAMIFPTGAVVPVKTTRSDNLNLFNFATVVKHKGRKANPFIDRAVKKLPQFVQEELSK